MAKREDKPSLESTVERLLTAVDSLEHRVGELEALIADKDVRGSLAETLRTIADELDDDEDDVRPARKSDPNEDE